MDRVRWINSSRKLTLLLHSTMESLRYVGTEYGDLQTSGEGVDVRGGRGSLGVWYLGLCVPRFSGLSVSLSGSMSSHVGIANP